MKRCLPLPDSSKHNMQFLNKGVSCYKGGKSPTRHTLGEWLTLFQWQMLALLVHTGSSPFAVSAYLQRLSQRNDRYLGMVFIYLIQSYVSTMKSVTYG